MPVPSGGGAPAWAEPSWTPGRSTGLGGGWSLPPSEKLPTFSRAPGLLGHLTVSKCLCVVLRPPPPWL